MDYFKTLTIAGSDSGGGAGIQADIKTMSALGCYAFSVITSVTAQNTKGVYAIENLSPNIVEAQLNAVITDIRPDAIKVGMLGNIECINKIATILTENTDIPLIVDPVMVSTSGSKLMSDNAVEVFIKELLPIATLLTPNIMEAEVLSGEKISNVDSINYAARKIIAQGCNALLVKGGHISEEGKIDRLYQSNGEKIEFSSPTIITRNTHGTGCTLSSSITAFIAQGLGLIDAIREAKKYITNALKAGMKIKIGSGYGPVNHFYKPEKLKIHD